MKALLTGGAMACVAACLAACASAPETIVARATNSAAFDGLTCAQLEAQRAQTDASLGVAEAAQRRIRRIDAIGVALVLLPVGSLTGGNHAREIGGLKGQLDALHNQIARAECLGSSPDDAPISTNISEQGS
jgi:hypothetical protein